MVSRATGASGNVANGDARLAMVSCDGRYVTFASTASNLAPDDPDTTSDVFVRDLENATTTLVSRATGATGDKGNGGSFDPVISADGRFVTFGSTASNLDPNDDDGIDDVYVRDMQSTVTTLVSRASGAAGAKGNGASAKPWISREGRYVAFRSVATNLDSDDPDAINDVFVRDLQSSTTALVSRAEGAAGVKGNGASLAPQIALDGRYVAFYSMATNLDGADTDTTSDVYVRDLESATTTLASRASGAGGVKGNGASRAADDLSRGTLRRVRVGGVKSRSGRPALRQRHLRARRPRRRRSAATSAAASAATSAATSAAASASGTATSISARPGATAGAARPVPPAPPPPDQPAAPAGPSRPTPSDSDNDGVSDARDKCPHESSKPRDANRNGCLDYRRVEGRFLLVPDRYLRFPFRDPIRDILGIKVRSLVGTRLTKGAVVELTCSRRACQRERVKVGASRRVVFSRIAGRKLRTGTRLTIRATLDGAVGLGTRYVVTPNDFTKHRFCIRPKSTRKGSCRATLGAASPGFGGSGSGGGGGGGSTTGGAAEA